MVKETVRVVIGKDGKVTVGTEGIEGKSCVEATQELEAYLGKKATDATFTAEYYKEPPKGPEPWLKRT